MVIVNVDIPAGPTINEAIRECLEFSGHNRCMVRVNLNNVDMLIVDSPVFGKDISERVERFHAEFQFRLKQLQGEHNG